MNDFIQDIAIIAGLCAVGALSAWLAYRLGAPVWAQNFAVPQLDPIKWRGGTISSAELGELGNLGIVAGILILLLVLTPDASLCGVIRAWPWWIGGLFLTGIVVVFIHTRLAVGRVRKSHRFAREDISVSDASIARFRVGYNFYVGYGVVISMLMLGIFLVILMQLLIDAANFEAIARRIDFVFAQAQRLAVGGGEPILGKYEVAFGQQRIAEGYILDEVNSMLMLLLCISIAYTAVYRTRMRHVFAPSALAILRYCMIGMLGICIVYGCYVFFNKHLTFVDHMLSEFRRYELVMDTAGWEMTQRYNEMIADLTKQRGVFGFLLALTTDRGGLILVIPLLQFLQPWKAPKDNRDKHVTESV